MMEKGKFIDYIQYEKRYSHHTVSAYRNDLDQFFNFLQINYNITDICEVTHPMIRSWVVLLMEEKMSPRSVNRKITTLKSFYKFLLREGRVSINPMKKIISPKTSKKLPSFIAKEKMERLFDTIDFGEGFPGIRDKIVLEILYDTGMRLSELINLKESDIDFHRSTLKVLGKRNKERLIPFSDNFSAILKTYQQARKRFLEEEKPKIPFASLSSQWLIITDSGNQAYPRFIYSTVTRYLAQVTTLQKISPHVLRHTFATHLLNNGADLNAVKELLGHANLAATQVYTHNTIDKLKTIYKLAHPKA
jgi:integrase/recombinase XerC